MLNWSSLNCMGVWCLLRRSLSGKWRSSLLSWHLNISPSTPVNAKHTHTHTHKHTHTPCHPFVSVSLTLPLFRWAQWDGCDVCCITAPAKLVTIATQETESKKIIERQIEWESLCERKFLRKRSGCLLACFTHASISDAFYYDADGFQVLHSDPLL